MYFLLQHCRFADGSDGALLVREGRIEERLEKDATAPARARTISAQGRLVLPAFPVAQLHVCKSYWREALARERAEVQSMPRFEAARHIKKAYKEEDVEARTERALQMGVRHGVGAIRLFCDVDKNAGLTALRGVMAAVRRWREVLRIEVAAFPQDGFDRDLLSAALDKGASLLGGIPFLGKNPEAREGHARACFELAVERNVDLHFVADDIIEPATNTLETIARLAIEHKYQGRVAASQCVALSHLPDEDARRTIDLVKEAGVTIVSNPHVGLVCHAGAASPQPRGATRWRQLRDAGVPLVCAQGDIDNWHYPFGVNDPLQVGLLAAHAFPLAWGKELDDLRACLLDTPAEFLGLAQHGLNPGCEASFTVIDAADWKTALQETPVRLLVVLKGRPVASNRAQRRIVRLDREPYESDWDYFLQYLEHLR